MRREQYEYVARPFRCVLANSFLLLVRQALKIHKEPLKWNLIVQFSNLDTALAFGIVYVVSKRRQQAL